MSSSRSPIRLLHIDDDPMFLDLSKTFFEEIGDAFDVDTIEDPGEVLTRLAEEAYDAVVSDHDMLG